jgi:hypothetical protein
VLVRENGGAGAVAELERVCGISDVVGAANNLERRDGGLFHQ